MRSPRLHVAAVLAGMLVLALAVPATARAPGMTVRIPSSQDVDRVYVLAAIHQKRCSLHVSGTALGHRFKSVRKRRVTIHLTNQAFLRLSSSAERSVKRALRRGRRVTARITVVASNSRGQRNRVTRSVRLRD
jgi:hypothetical protein